jgi:hypothetical protein
MKRLLVIAAIVVGISMGLVPVTNADPTSAIIYKDCEIVRFIGTVAEGELGRLEVRLHNSADWQSAVLQDVYIVINPGPFDVTVPWVANPDGRLNRTAFSASANGGSTWTALVINEDFLECPPPGGEGCTPGYWKNHLEDWPPTGYDPADDFDATFGVDFFDPDITLEEATRARGGGVKKLARHGTAALLSAAHPDVDYPFTVAEVIALVQAGDVDPLVDANELGCDIP